MRLHLLGWSVLISTLASSINLSVIIAVSCLYNATTQLVVALLYVTCTCPCD